MRFPSLLPLFNCQRWDFYYISNKKTRSVHQKDRYQRIQRRQAAFLFSLIFLIAASHAASIFLCYVYGSHSFPYCLIAASPAAFYFSTLHLSACSFPYYLSLSIILEHSSCRASGDFLIFSLRSSSCHAAVRQPVQPGFVQRDDA